MDDIKPATGLFRWLFSSGTRKQRAEDAYQSLTETIQGEYGLQLGKLSDRRRNLKFYSESDAWDDFQKQPVKYNNTVDERATDLLEEKQTVFDAFADKSVAAQKVEVDKKTFGNIIQEEIDRINGERKSKVKA